MGKKPAYTKSEILPEGTVINDRTKCQWIVGKKLGEGGFGAIYTVSESPSKVFDKVIKIEPRSNGPLYTEVNFYSRVCCESDIYKWMNLKKLKFLGIPRYISGGAQDNSDNRFLIMDRYGEDLHKILMKNNLSNICKMQIAINLLDVLEYIHSREYVHADIKALNILQGSKSTKEVYLLDFGMVNKFTLNGTHKPEKIDNKIKHNGTLEFCPRDSHRGLVSCRRSDIESLMYNLIFWLSWNENLNSSSRVGYGNLPWLIYMKNIGDKPASPAVLKQVTESKEKYMKDTKLFIETVGLNVHPWSKRLTKILDYVANLQYMEEPNYEEMRMDFARIISEIRGESTKSALNLNSFREIDWKPACNKPRKSDIGTQSDAIISRKRPSSNSDDFIQEKPVKRKRSDGKMRVLEVNNSAVLPEEKSTKKSSAKKNTKLKIAKEPEFALERNPEEIKDKIPAAAFLRIPKISEEKSQEESSSKENLDNNKPNISRLKKVVKSKAKKLKPVENATDYSQIIPGLKRIKPTELPTRSSPRNIPKKTCSSNTRILKSNSVSCQTSPSLSFTKRSLE